MTDRNNEMDIQTETERQIMKKIKYRNDKITFETFLSGTPARDYVFQKTPYEEQIRLASQMLQDAEYVLVGAGAGMSAAAGAQYGGTFFEENFGEFQKKYGKGPYMQDMYSAGFYPYPDEESYWGYWSKQAILGGIDLDVTPLHKMFLSMFSGKKIFVLSTNADGQFVKAGLPEDQIFCTQGDYFHIQCGKGCHDKLYDAVDLFRQMDQAAVIYPRRYFGEENEKKHKILFEKANKRKRDLEKQGIQAEIFREEPFAKGDDGPFKVYVMQFTVKKGNHISAVEEIR